MQLTVSQLASVLNCCGYSYGRACTNLCCCYSGHTCTNCCDRAPFLACRTPRSSRLAMASTWCERQMRTTSSRTTQTWLAPPSGLLAARSLTRRAQGSAWLPSPSYHRPVLWPAQRQVSRASVVHSRIAPCLTERCSQIWAGRHLGARQVVRNRTGRRSCFVAPKSGAWHSSAKALTSCATSRRQRTGAARALCAWYSATVQQVSDGFVQISITGCAHGDGGSLHSKNTPWDPARLRHELEVWHAPVARAARQKTANAAAADVLDLRQQLVRAQRQEERVLPRAVVCAGAPVVPAKVDATVQAMRLQLVESQQAADSAKRKTHESHPKTVRDEIHE